jgi:hypothetical protein
MGKMKNQKVKPLQMEIKETQKLIDDLLWEDEPVEGLEAYLDHLMELDKKGEKYYCLF